MRALRTSLRLCCYVAATTTVALVAATAHPASSDDNCPCDDPKLCRPLTPAPKPQDEVVAFPAWEIYGAGYNESDYTLYDWSKITTIAPFEPLYHPGPPSAKKRAAQQLYCTAHRHGVKVLQWSEASWNGTNCGADEFYGWCRKNDPRIFNSTAVNAWAASTAACIKAQGFDGILLDAEGSYTVGKPQVKAAVTKAVCTLKTALRRAVPHAVIYWTADTGPYFDYGTLTADGCVDLWLDMDYCRCSPTNRGGNAAISSIAGITEKYKSYGVNSTHLGIIFPWFGCDFVCLDSSCKMVVKKPQSERILPGDSNSGNTPHGGDGCGLGVDAGPGYAEVLQLMPNATTKPTIDPTTYTSYFSWRNGSGGVHQVWYDDPVTLDKKFKAAKAKQLKAIGMWTSDANMFNREAAAAMWKAVPAPRNGAHVSD